MNDTIFTSEGEQHALTDSELHSAIWHAAQTLADTGHFGDVEPEYILREYFGMIDVNNALYSIVDCDPCADCNRYQGDEFTRTNGESVCADCRESRDPETLNDISRREYAYAVGAA